LLLLQPDPANSLLGRSYSARNHRSQFPDLHCLQKVYLVLEIGWRENLLLLLPQVLLYWR
jgi:hypothetical protein